MFKVKNKNTRTTSCKDYHNCSEIFTAFWVILPKNFG